MKWKVSAKAKSNWVSVTIKVQGRSPPHYDGEVLLKGKFKTAEAAIKVVNTFVEDHKPTEVIYER